LKAGAVSAFQVAQARDALNQVQLAIGGAERQAAEAQVNLAEAVGIPEQLDCGRARMCVCVNGRLVRFAQRSGYRADTFVISGDFLAEMAAGNGDLSKISRIDTFLIFARMRSQNWRNLPVLDGSRPSKKKLACEIVL
jgi:hypothetical protein